MNARKMKKVERRARIAPTFVSPALREKAYKTNRDQVHNPYDVEGIVKDLRGAAGIFEARHLSKELITHGEVEKVIGIILLKHALKDQLHCSQRFVKRISSVLDSLTQFLKTETEIPPPSSARINSIERAERFVNDLNSFHVLILDRLENSDRSLLLDRQAQDELEGLNQLLASHSGEFRNEMRRIIDTAVNRFDRKTRKPVTLPKAWGGNVRSEVWRIIDTFTSDLKKFVEDSREVERIGSNNPEIRAQVREGVARNRGFLWAERIL